MANATIKERLVNFFNNKAIAEAAELVMKQERQFFKENLNTLLEVSGVEKLKVDIDVATKVAQVQNMTRNTRTIDFERLQAENMELYIQLQDYIKNTVTEYIDIRLVKK